MPKLEDSLQELKKKITEEVVVYAMAEVKGVNGELPTTDEIKNVEFPITTLDKESGKMIQMPISVKKLLEYGLSMIQLDNGFIALVKPINEASPIYGNLSLKNEIILPTLIHGEALLNQAKAQELKSIIPQKHIKPNNKLANEITKDFINEGEMSLNVGRRGSKREISTKAMLSYQDEKISLSGRIAFTPYDREVHDGVVTLYEAGNEVITPEMVYRAMNGMTETEKISPQAVETVTESLDKSRRTTLKINFTEEARAYKKAVKATYEGYLLACDKITVTTGGQTKEAYKLLRKPILYEYSQVSGQIINVPIKLLQTKEAVRSTEEVIVIRGYLLRQIEYMKSSASKRNNHISYEGIYSELNITEENYNAAMYKKKTHTIRQHVTALLSEWVRLDYLKSYSEYKEGKTIKGVAIIL